MEDSKKTNMCKHWRNGVDCPFKERCLYAHGEVRTIQVLVVE